ncbi:hypothetical protein LCGC14_1586000 [marine sediment metagenome]|uniref:Uncharacterized protein n=1 Tax=marine sediment metagenome TaxID=412755 RepID=A0A0F9LFR7_9ZZZZ
MCCGSSGMYCTGTECLMWSEAEWQAWRVELSTGELSCGAEGQVCMGKLGIIGLRCGKDGKEKL